MSDEVQAGVAEGEVPFRRAGLWRRIGVLAVVAVAAEASLALPPGPTSTADTMASAILLAAVAVAIVVLPWRSLPPVASVAVPLAYLASATLLAMAAGGPSAGVGLVVLIPLVWTALYHRRWESLLVVAGIVVVEVVTSLDPIRDPAATIVRRAGSWAILGVAAALAVHGLRDRVRAAWLEREGLHRAQGESLARTVALAHAAEELTATLDAEEVLRTAVRVAAELVAPSSSSLRRAQYVRVVDGEAVLAALYDETGGRPWTRFPLHEHPALEHAVLTGLAAHGPFDLAAVGHEVRALAEDVGVRCSVYVPVVIDGAVDGVLAVSVRDRDVGEELFEQCKSVGHLIELALANALEHEDLHDLATKDALTGLVNRRAFDELMVRRPGRGSFAVLVVDLDGLKAVNDRFGHLAGDTLLAVSAQRLAGVLRRGDVMARTGGDEFAALCFEADLPTAQLIADRMLAALGTATVGGTTARASVGVAVGRPEDGALDIFRAADDAMYEAKRAGGGQVAVASVASSPGAQAPTTSDGPKTSVPEASTAGETPRRAQTAVRGSATQ